MTVLEDLSADFAPSIRRAGEHYYRTNAVTLLTIESQFIRSRVRGTSMYKVEVQWDHDEYRCECSCPFFERNTQPCKHIWATLLAADAAGHLVLPQTNGDSNGDSEAAEDDAADDWDLRPLPRHRPPALPTAPTQATGERHHAVWRRRLQELRGGLKYLRTEDPAPWPTGRKILYLVDVPASTDDQRLCVELAVLPSTGVRSADARPKRLRLSPGHLQQLPEESDRQLVRLVAGVGREDFADYHAEIPSRFYLHPGDSNDIIRQMCQTGRCHLRPKHSELDPVPLHWDDTGPWELRLSLLPQDNGETYKLSGLLRRGEEKLEIADATLCVPGGPIFHGQTAAALEDFGAFEFIHLLRSEREIVVPAEHSDELIGELLRFPRLPKLELPESIGVTEVHAAPRPRLHLTAGRAGGGSDNLSCQLWFDYGQKPVAFSDPGPAIFAMDVRQILHRDLAMERTCAGRLRDLGFRQVLDSEQRLIGFRLPARLLPAAVRALTVEHWHIEVDGKAFRKPGNIRMDVRSGIDWFELSGEIDFDGASVQLPALLQTIRRGESTIVLDDGTLGILPEQWLQKYQLLAAIGEESASGENHVQFGKNQAGLLDALLAAEELVNVDESFERARSALRDFAGVEAVNPPATFIGELRPYQRDGLGWMNFLASFGLGGCLADDMGLGKTVQVLALLEQRRLQRIEHHEAVNGTKNANGNAAANGNGNGNGNSNGATNFGPTLVVVPRSLVFNWKQEAARFSPQLRVLDHAAGDRLRTIEHFSDYDLILTTYGTLRNDAAVLKDLRFDYVILDEAQAIKNASSESAKAARLLRCDHRLALSGTPVQNHLGELWSLFEFLNPGMLGASRAFGASLAAGGGKTVDAETRQVLASALRPFILRRTKEQVATDLPEKFEQTIFCELDTKQRQLYDELKAHYRQSLMQRIDESGLNKSKIQVLEALLRLRQAACHPGLLDKTRLAEPSAKLDTLLDRLDEIVEEGHKAIVFSQFTSLLAIVRDRLDTRGVPYEYLDGKTRDRQERVDRFQTDTACPLFLVSLKAGGVGLNLTAAQYVFLLDPWWNPAVEAQAIDRAHRIGQTQQVFAYRLIAKDTVEEKVLQLQQSKRELADAIINADNALISKLGREDLELLLS